MARKPIEKIKHGDKILGILDTPKLFSQIYCETSIDQRTVQDALAQLVKHGYCVKDARGRYARTEAL